MGVIFDLDQTAFCLQICNDCLAALVAVHTLVLAAVCVDGCIVVEHQNLLQIMAQTHLKVVRVVARRGLDTAGTELLVDIIVGKDRNLTADDRQDCLFADQVLIALVVRIDCNAGIAHEGLRAGGRYDDALVRILNVILDIPQLARLRLILNLSIGQCGCTVRTPVDDAGALVDQTLVVQVDKDFLDRLGTAFVHREALAAPVTGGTELLQLLDDAVAVLVLPVPDALEELLAAEIIAGQTLLLAEVLLNLDLCCDTGVVGTRHPQCRITLHALGTDQNILQGFVKCMTHMQLTRDIRGRNDNGIRFFVLIYFCIEVAVFFPFLIELFLCRTGIIRLWQFVCHSKQSPFFMI